MSPTRSWMRPLPLLCALALGWSAEADLVVAADGDDAAPGTREHPLRTPGRALVLLRTAISTGSRIIELRGGTYRLAAPLELGPDLSGALIRSADGEVATLTGGGEERTWIADGPGRWRLEGVEAMPAAIGVGEALWPPSRWPAEGPLRLTEAAGRRLAWSATVPLPAGTRTHALIAGDWMVSRAPLVVQGPDRGELIEDPTWQGSAWHRLAAGRGLWIEAEPGLPQPPGSWAFDAPRTALVVSAAERPPAVRLPALGTLLRIAGTADRPVRGITLQRLRLRDGGWTSAGRAGGVQAGKVVVGGDPAITAIPAALHIEWASDVRIERCAVGPSAGGGIAIGPGSRRVVVQRSRLDGVGANGITIGWRRATSGLADDWPDASWAPRGVVVERCAISRCALVDWGSVGIAVWFSQDHVLSHNLVEELPYSGISLGYRWDPGTSSQRGGLVERNRIRGVMSLLADGGALYTLGSQRGLLVRGNHVSEVRRPAWATGSPNNGFFFDQGSAGIGLSGNRCDMPPADVVRHNESQASTIVVESTGPGTADGGMAAQAGPGEGHVGP